MVSLAQRAGLLSSTLGDYRSGQHPVSLVELATGKSVQRTLLSGEQAGPLAFSPDGRMFATVVSEPEREILLYERASGNVRGVIRGYRGDVRGLMFFPDNRRLASSQTDATVLIWGLESAQAPKKGG
jgi:WD40 repeat protein